METAAKTLRFRRSAAITVAAAVGFLGALPMLGGGTWYALILLVPLAIMLWSWRSGTDVTPDGLVVRAAIGARSVPWTEVAELAPAPQGGVVVRLTSGATLTLPAVPTSALPAIVSIGGELIRA